MLSPLISPWGPRRQHRTWLAAGEGFGGALELTRLA